MAWLQSKDREYPVYIDPEVSVSSSGSFAETFVDSGSPNGNYSTYEYMRSSQNHICLIKVLAAALPTLGSGDVILESTLNLNRYNANSSYANREIKVSPINDNQTWDVTTVTWNTKPTYDTSRVWSFGISSVPYQYTSFDITELVKNWTNAGATTSPLAQTKSIILAEMDFTVRPSKRKVGWDRTLLVRAYLKIA